MDYKINIPNDKDPLCSLFYEIEMLESSLPLGYMPKDIIDQNVRLESFLLHARNLIDFLENNKSGNDDIVISIFRDVNNNPISSIQLSLLLDIKQKINKHISHLTMTRQKEKFAWKTGLIKNSINQGLLKFFNQISNSYFPDGDGKSKDDFKNLITNNLIQS